MMEVVVTIGAVRHAKLHWNCQHEHANTQLITVQMPGAKYPKWVYTVWQCGCNV